MVYFLLKDVEVQQGCSTASEKCIGTTKHVPEENREVARSTGRVYLGSHFKPQDFGI